MRTKFDQGFYDFVYGTIHHHAYAENRARELIGMYGYGPSLELGAGCGILVKAMREMGADAWGIDVSDYAISERCTPYLLRANARHLPFKSETFDLVHSWAMFGYDDEVGTEVIIAECKRVGRRQYHTIDFQQTEPYSYGYVFMKPRPWWDERIKNGA